MHDYHLHTYLCKHAYGEIEDYVETAIKNGISEICFADHIPLPGGFDADHRMELKDMDTYLDQIDACKVKYSDISILVGIEVDYIEGYEEYLEGFLSSFHFDLVIMSIHFVKEWSDNQWVFNFLYTEKTLIKKYIDYFNAMEKGIKTGLFDAVGHLDLVKQPGYPVLDTNQKDIEHVLNAVSQAGMSIELNTSGLRKPINDIYPSLEILELAVKKGIPLILSSDAHKPEHVGYCFDELMNYLFELTDLQLACYRKRECIKNKLGQPGMDLKL